MSVPCLIFIPLFGVNNPGQDLSGLQGGVEDWLILRGVLRVVDDIKVWSGISTKDYGDNGRGGNVDHMF